MVLQRGLTVLKVTDGDAGNVINSLALSSALSQLTDNRFILH